MKRCLIILMGLMAGAAAWGENLNDIEYFRVATGKWEDVSTHVYPLRNNESLETKVHVEGSMLKDGMRYLSKAYGNNPVTGEKFKGAWLYSYVPSNKSIRVAFKDSREIKMKGTAEVIRNGRGILLKAKESQYGYRLESEMYYDGTNIIGSGEMILTNGMVWSTQEGVSKRVAPKPEPKKKANAKK